MDTYSTTKQKNHFQMILTTFIKLIIMNMQKSASTQKKNLAPYYISHMRSSSSFFFTWCDHKYVHTLAIFCNYQAVTTNTRELFFTSFADSFFCNYHFITGKTFKYDYYLR